MSWLEALLVSAIQGLGEFLPISAPGHIAVAQAFLPSLSSSTLLWHASIIRAGAAAAAVVYFRRELALWKAGRRRELLWIVLGSGLLIGLGLLARDKIEEMSAFSEAACLFWIVNGLVLLSARSRGTATLDAAPPRRFAAVILAQIPALLPGISRTGMALRVGLGALAPEEAFRLSAMLSVPLSLGGLAEACIEPVSVDPGPLALGLVASFGFGLAGLGILGRMLKGRGLQSCALYTIFAGAIGLVYFFLLRKLL